jgi:hypothetical protein
MTPDRLELITRRNCPLCELAVPVVLEVAATRRLGVSEIDVDEDEQLAREFTDRVPVARFRGRVLVEGRFGSAQLQAALAKLLPPAGQPTDESVTAVEIAIDRG